ncbi:MAG TPA: hypothetical protein VJB14_11590 [Planctomycetota bacterium]|nr:hypothetical protein [Planctomycetota bacterium]
MRILIAAMFMAGAMGAGWAQDAEKGEKGKETPRPKAEGAKDGAGAGFLTLDQVDSNGDGKVTRAELEAAIKKLGGVREGDKKAPPKGEGVKEGDRKAPPKPEGARDGDKKAPPKPDGAKEGDK